MAEQKKGLIGIGVIGCGSVADLAHFPSLKEIPQVRLEAACDPVAEYRDRAKAKWSIPRVFADYQDMLKLSDVHLVIVASPNVFHREHAVAALQAGKDVIIEKPFACTNREAWDIVEAAKKNNRRVMVGCNYRFWEQHLIAKDLLSRGVIGEVKMGTSKSHEAWSLYHEMISFTRFRADVDLAAAGALFDLGSHMTDLLIWLMGRKPKRVCGTAKNLTRPSSYTVLDDCVFIQIEFEGGAYGVVDLNRFSPAVTQGCELLGTEGTILTSSEANLLGPGQYGSAAEEAMDPDLPAEGVGLQEDDPALRRLHRHGQGAHHPAGRRRHRHGGPVRRVRVDAQRRVGGPAIEGGGRPSRLQEESVTGTQEEAAA